MFELKKIHREAIPKALERVERYRLLNQPRVAESICHDILEIEPDNQQALVGLVLALTDQFEKEANKGINAALELIPRLAEEYTRDYYTGLVHERQGKARLARDYPGARFDAFELLSLAMEWYEKAQTLQPPDNDDAILHWNSCARIIVNNKLEPRPHEGEPLMSE
jgi:tetratricopeptide (TPR) repeat protein